MTQTAVTFDLSKGQQGWTFGLSNYYLGSEGDLEIASGYRQLPAQVNGVSSGLYVHGGRSLGLQMYYAREVLGLQPMRTYSMVLNVDLVTESTRCGSNVDNNVVFAGAMASPPVVIVQASKRVLVDFGPGVTMIGNLSAQFPCTNSISMQLRSLTSAPLTVSADAAGSVWLIMGLGIEESTISAYFTRFDAVLNPN
jgi:hypothetical protein